MTTVKQSEIVVAIDPGVKGSGVAVFHGTFLWVASYRTSGDIFDAAFNPEHLTYPKMQTPVRIVLEKPQVYRTGRLKGDPNDLIDVAVAGGEMLGRALERFRRCGIDPASIVVEKIVPAVWKGQLPKEVAQERIERALASHEVTCIVEPHPASLMHNVWDAIGIGLWAVKRFKC